jgi:tRNA pseudouridine13 synthase
MSLQDEKKRKSDDDIETSNKRVQATNGVGDAVREADVGIEEFVSQDLTPIEGGIIKQRYSDFHVREVDRYGNVCRITSLWPNKVAEGGSGLFERLEEQQAVATSGVKEQERAEEDVGHEEEVREWQVDPEQMSLLQEFFDEGSLEQLRRLWTQGAVKGRDSRAVTSFAIESKERRTALHQLIRQISEGRLISDTVTSQGSAGSIIKVRWGSTRSAEKPSVKSHQTNGKQEPTQLASKPYIHFLLQKTNRDSQDALNVLSRSLGLLNRSNGSSAGKDLTIAGTKDKRGITVQQVSLKRGRRTLDEVWRSANGLHRHGRDDVGNGRRGALDVLKRRADRGVRIAHLKYADTPLRLGELHGNAFSIVLRSIKIPDRKIIDRAFEVLTSRGFINYFGMQRFGTSTISTHTVGVAVLANDYRKAIQLILSPRQGDPDGVKQARQAYESGRLREAFDLFPHFNVPERSIVQRMRDDRTAPFQEGVQPFTYESADWRKYFSALPRTLRTIYVHAFQSYVWNRIASERVRRFGLDDVQVGDVVGLGSDEWLEMGELGDEDGKDDDDDMRANAATSSTPDLPWRRKVKTIESEEEAKRYTIHDVMIAMPGTHVQFPSNSWAEEAYLKILAEDGLTHDDMLRAAAKSPELSLTGDYRKLLHLPKDVSYELIRYADPNVNLIQSDEDRLLGLDAVPPHIPFVDQSDETAKDHPFVALILHLTLGVSAYATMALREILKQETSSAHQRQLTMKGEDRKGSRLQ